MDTAGFPGPNAGEAGVIRCEASPGFQEWLARAGGSLAISTYQAGKVALVGWSGRQVSLLMRQFEKPMGIAVEGRRLALALRHDVVLLADAPGLAGGFLEDQPGRYDALYLPRVSYHTGDLNVHDLAFGADGLWMVNTRYSCLAGPSDGYSFVPRWSPPFVTACVPEDRCHLNGLAMVEGRPGYVTALGESDEVGGWRDGKADGGVLLDVGTGESVLRGLSMPHSPRWSDGRLWLLNSGAGELLRVDPRDGSCDVACALPGYLRGLCLVGSHALVGMSKIRERHLFGGLPVLTRNPQLFCGVALIDLRTGGMTGLLEFTAACTELYDVQFLPNISRPMILNREQAPARQAFPAPGSSYWLRPGALVADAGSVR